MNTKTVLQEREQIIRKYGQPLAISELNERNGKLVLIVDHTGCFEPEHHLVQAEKNMLVNSRGRWRWNDIKKGYCSAYMPKMQ